MGRIIISQLRFLPRSRDKDLPRDSNRIWVKMCIWISRIETSHKEKILWLIKHLQKMKMSISINMRELCMHLIKRSQTLRKWSKSIKLMMMKVGKDSSWIRLHLKTCFTRITGYRVKIASNKRDCKIGQRNDKHLKCMVSSSNPIIPNLSRPLMNMEIRMNN